MQKSANKDTMVSPARTKRTIGTTQVGVAVLTFVLIAPGWMVQPSDAEEMVWVSGVMRCKEKVKQGVGEGPLPSPKVTELAKAGFSEFHVTGMPMVAGSQTSASCPNTRDRTFQAVVGHTGCPSRTTDAHLVLDMAPCQATDVSDFDDIVQGFYFTCFGTQAAVAEKLHDACLVVMLLKQAPRP